MQEIFNYNNLSYLCIYYNNNYLFYESIDAGSHVSLATVATSPTTEFGLQVLTHYVRVRLFRRMPSKAAYTLTMTKQKSYGRKHTILNPSKKFQVDSS